MQFKGPSRYRFLRKRKFKEYESVLELKETAEASLFAMKVTRNNESERARFQEQISEHERNLAIIVEQLQLLDQRITANEQGQVSPQPGLPTGPSVSNSTPTAHRLF